MSSRTTAEQRTDTLFTSGTLRAAVLDRIADDPEAAGDPSDRSALRRAVARALAAEGVVLSPQAWARAVRDLVDEIAGLGPLEHLLRDPDVTDVCCNAADDIWVDRRGDLVRAPTTFQNDEHLIAVVRRAVGRVGQRWDPGHPLVDARLPGGVRLHAVLPPLAPSPAVTLRRVATLTPTWDELLAGGTVTDDLADLLRACVDDQRNIVVAGRAGSGKTTLLARLLAGVGDDRVVVIEDTPELGHPSRHCVTLQTVLPSADGIGGVDAEELLRNALRMRPDRLVVGEVRGREAAVLLQAMNTGHDGSMTTVHANGAEDARVRLEGMALMAGVPLPAVRAQLGAAIDVIVAMDRAGPQRRVIEVVEVVAGRASVAWSRP